MRARLTTKGLEALLGRLAKKGIDIDRVADIALSAGGQVIEDGMRRRAPVKTGELRKNLGMSGPWHTGNLHWVWIGMFPGRKLPAVQQPRVHRYSNRTRVWYGVYQEMGKKGRLKAKRFIQGTWEQDESKARKVMKEIFQREESK